MTQLLDRPSHPAAPRLEPHRRPPGPRERLPELPPPRRRAAWLRGWVHRHARSLPIVLALAVVAVVVLGTGAAHYPGWADDEGTYAAQAWAVRSQGTLAHYTYWYDHPPLGWLQLALAGWMLGPFLGGDSTVADARSLMLVPALASALLLYVLARRLGLRRPFAAAAVLLFALSPLAVVSLRQVYLDNLAMPWLLAAFVLAASPRRRLWAYAGAGACFAASVLTKETMLLLLPALVWQALQGADRRTRSFCMAAFTAALVLVGVGYPLFAMLKGELLPGPGHVSLLEAVRFQFYGRPGTGNPLAAGSAAHELVASWVRTDPWLLAVGLGAGVLALAVRRLRPIGAALALLVLGALRPGYLPQPYVIALLPFCALAIAGVLDIAWGRWTWDDRRAWLPRAVVAAGVPVLVVLSAPGWWRSDAYAMREDQTRPVRSAERWIEGHVDRRARVLVDDTLYVDLVRAGFAQRFGAVWFYKLDFTTNLDPLIVRNLPQGWRAFDYVVSTRVIRSALAQSPDALQQVRLALRNSRAVATFGEGAGRVEVRRVVGIGTGSGLIPHPPRATHGRAG